MPIKADNESHIKQEPTMAGMSAPTMAYNNAGAARGGMAAQRAAQALENRYGQRAAASIDAIQSGQAQAQALQQGQGQRPGQPQQPQQMQQMQQMQMNHQQMNQQQMNQQQMNQQHMNQQQMNQQQMMSQQQAVQHQLSQQQQYRQGMAASMQQRMPQQPPSSLPKAQHDGAADGFEGVLLQHGPDSRPVEMGRVEIDKVMHAQMAARAREMEGGGLMVPLKEVKRQAGAASKKATSGGPPQLDGPDDEDTKVELDEDAINSDLDDPDEPKDEDEDDDDSMGHMMLCMYDKVQRVKNKW
jgi:transcription initiation factor TFIIA large subunit